MPPSRAAPILVPIHAILLSFPIALFSTAAMADVTYLNTAEIQWTNFAQWAITGALVFGAPVVVHGPVLLAFDGERKRRLHDGETAVLRVLRDGPRVIDVRAVMAAAARAGLFVGQSSISECMGKGAG